MIRPQSTTLDDDPVAAELSRLGFIASPTSRSALGADILVTDQACLRAFSVQVKTDGSRQAFWLVGKHVPISNSHFYVLVRVDKTGDAKPEFFVVPSRVAKQRTKYERARSGSEWWCLYRKDILDFRDKWDVFGDPHAEAASQDTAPGTGDEPTRSLRS